jgi:hypothetical protein
VQIYWRFYGGEITEMMKQPGQRYWEKEVRLHEPNKPTSYQAGYQQRNNETKSSVLLGHTPGGSANLFNNTGTGAVHLKAEDSTLISRREVVPTSRSTILSPSSAQLGQSSGLKDSAKIYETYNANRNNEDLLLQFLENPYTTTRFSK